MHPKDEAMADATLPLWHEAFAGLDWVSLRMSPTYAGVDIKRGAGQPVVLVPGLMASDASLHELKCWLDRMGYDARYASVGRITGCPTKLARQVAATVRRVHKATKQPVSLIGHSLGGCLARRVAMDCPGSVRQVITLGSPVQGARIHPAVIALGRQSHGCDDAACYEALQLPLPARVPETCIYTKRDGIVHWRTCMRSTRSRNVEVRGTHIGLIWNPQVFREIARTLSTMSPRRSELTLPITSAAIQIRRAAA